MFQKMIDGLPDLRLNLAHRGTAHIGPAIGVNLPADAELGNSATGGLLSQTVPSKIGAKDRTSVLRFEEVP